MTVILTFAGGKTTVITDVREGQFDLSAIALTNAEFAREGHALHDVVKIEILLP